MLCCVFTNFTPNPPDLLLTDLLLTMFKVLGGSGPQHVRRFIRLCSAMPYATEIAVSKFHM